jgi:hypothetical protein
VPTLACLTTISLLAVLKIYDVRPHDTHQVFTEVESLRPTEKKTNLSYSAVDVQWHPTESTYRACALLFLSLSLHAPQRRHSSSVLSGEERVNASCVLIIVCSTLWAHINRQ